MEINKEGSYQVSVEIAPFNGEFCWLIIFYCDRVGRLVCPPSGRYEIKYCKTDHDGFEEWYSYPIMCNDKRLEYVTIIEKETNKHDGEFWELVPALCRHYS